MEKLVEIASALLLVASFTSCCNDESGKSASIIRKWNFSTQKISIPNGFLLSEGPYERNEPGCNADYLEFSEDHVAVAGDYGENCVLEWIPFTYNRYEKDLTLSFGPMDDTDYRIIIANETTLVLENRYQQDGTTRVAEVKYLKASHHQ